MKKWIALFLSMIMLLSLAAGCGKKPSTGGTAPVGGTTAPNEKPGGENGDVGAPEGTVGSLLINADVIVTLYYDTDGTILKAEGNNLAGAELLETYNELTGSHCSEVVGKIIKDGHAQNSAGNITSVIVKQNKDSVNPGDDFMSTVSSSATSAMKDISSKAELIVLAQEELVNGSIPLKQVKKLVMNFLGVKSLDSFAGADTPAGGFYQFEVVYNDTEETVHVNAATGAVGFGTVDNLTDAMGF